MDPVREANQRLRELGYDPAEARVERDGAGGLLRIAGDLLEETTADPDAIVLLLQMLPSKSELLAYRHAADLSTFASDPGIVRCAWCGRLRRDGEWDERLPTPDEVGARERGIVSDAMCPACFETFGEAGDAR